MPRIVPLFSKQLHNLFQHFHWFAIVVPHISAAYHECSSIFSTSRIGVHQLFLPFFVSSTFIIVSLFFHFLCSSIFILFITCFLFGIVFTWSLLWNIVSSILVICNCFIFRFHHISYIYIYCCPFPSILFQRDPKTPSGSELLVQNIMYAMHTVCFISCLRLATEQHCTLPQTGVNGKVYLIIPEIKTHTLAEVDEELLRGVKGFGGWVSLLYQNISSNVNNIYIYMSIYLPIYLSIYLSFKQIKYISRNLYTYKTGEDLKVRSTEEYLCQFCLINWPWKSKLPPSGETREWWNLGTLKPNKSGVPK